MIYFDTNVIIYALEIVPYDERLVKTAKSRFDKALKDQQTALSFLTVAEVAFVLAKLKVEESILEKTLNFLSVRVQEVVMDPSVIKDFLAISKKTHLYRQSFDVLHVEIARRLNCQKIVTFDRELKKLQPEYQDINIEILT